MKRLGNVFDRITSLENISAALDKAALHKKGREAVQKTLSRREAVVPQIRAMLVSGQYHTSSYHIKTVYEPKKRVIYALPFQPDRIVHHAIMLALEPYWDARLISDSYASRKNKGLHRGSTRCMELVRKYRYCLQCDVSKFYQSVDHEILKNLLRKKIKDERLLSLLGEIIDSANRIKGAVPGKNVPIGNLLSQWFGNIYLGELDFFIKQEKKVRPYIRYCDDFVLFSDSKEELNLLRKEIINFLDEKLSLRLSKANLFPVTQGVDFLGYRHFPQYILLRKRNAKKIKKFCREFFEGKHEKNLEHAKGVAASYHGLLSHGQTHNLRESTHFDEILSRLEIKT